MEHATQSVENAADPYLQYGEVIDLHPVYAAMALAQEVADANGTEVADVPWDPAWSDLEVDNDKNWNELVEKNWETLSCWYAMTLRAGRMGKILHMKVDNGVESAVATDVAPWRATQPLINASINDAPLPNHAMIRSHVKMLHMLAESAGLDGVLTLTRIDDKEKVFTERFAIGDVDGHANAAIGWSTHPGLNLYSPWAIFRKSMPRWSKGTRPGRGHT